MKLVCICVVLQILSIVCEPMSIQSLAKKFHYNLTQLPAIGEVVMWQITENSKTFQPQIRKRNIPKLDSKKTYLLFAQLKGLMKEIRILYWSGSTTPLMAKKVAANYALQLYSSLHDYFQYEIIISLHREEEFVESKFFDDTVSSVHQTGGLTSHTYRYIYNEEQLPYKLPNLYIVRGNTTTRVKAVPLGTQWFINDACIILETGYSVEELNPVATYCGPTANKNTISYTEHVDLIISLIYNRVESQPLEKQNPTFKAFVEALENKENYRSHEVDDSNDHLKDAETFVADRNENVSFHKIFRGQMTRIDPRIHASFSSYYYNVDVFDNVGCYLLDSGSIDGLFLSIHPNTEFQDKLKGLEMAEDYLHYKYSLASKPTRVRITEIYHLHLMPINLSINLSSFPTIAELEEQDENIDNLR